jgi:hypothetical protein
MDSYVRLVRTHGDDLSVSQGLKELLFDSLPEKKNCRNNLYIYKDRPFLVLEFCGLRSLLSIPRYRASITSMTSENRFQCAPSRLTLVSNAKGSSHWKHGIYIPG